MLLPRIAGSSSHHVKSNFLGNPAGQYWTITAPTCVQFHIQSIQELSRVTATEKQTAGFAFRAKEINQGRGRGSREGIQFQVAEGYGLHLKSHDYAPASEEYKKDRQSLDLQ